MSLGITEKGKEFAIYCGLRMWQASLPNSMVQDEFEEVLEFFNPDSLGSEERKQLAAFWYFLFFADFLGDKKEEIILKLMLSRLSEKEKPSPLS